MQLIIAPDNTTAKYPSVFLAGGITNCPEWQNELIAMLDDAMEITIYNPRRENFPIDDPNAAPIQIKWEYERLRSADLWVFWFSRGSVNPIVMFEYGSALERIESEGTNKHMIVGVDIAYPRIFDVHQQTMLRNPALQLGIVASLDNVFRQIKRWYGVHGHG